MGILIIEVSSHLRPATRSALWPLMAAKAATWLRRMQEDAKDPSTTEKPAAEDNNPGTSDNTTDNHSEPTDPVTNNTHSSDPVVTRTTVTSTPTATNTTAAEPAVISAAAVSAPVVTDYTTATAPQIVSTPVSNGETIVTGDESQMGLYLTLFAAAAAGLAAWFAGKHKKNFR